MDPEPKHVRREGGEERAAGQGRYLGQPRERWKVFPSRIPRSAPLAPRFNRLSGAGGPRADADADVGYYCCWAISSPISHSISPFLSSLPPAAPPFSAIQRHVVISPFILPCRNLIQFLAFEEV